MSLDALVELLEEAKPLLLKAGLTEDEVKKPLDERVDHTQVHLVICRVVNEEYKSYEKARQLVPEHMWDYYAVTGATFHAECKILAAAGRELRNAWRQRVLAYCKNLGSVARRDYPKNV